ncbi:hypothetical protein BJV77DRAFT_1070959 [Russula vinacea]|nr:hypothetical protein BJV77DRAFT_1070959 [Russula vinacea]
MRGLSPNTLFNPPDLHHFGYLDVYKVARTTSLSNHLLDDPCDKPQGPAQSAPGSDGSTRRSPPTVEQTPATELTSAHLHQLTLEIHISDPPTLDLPLQKQKSKSSAYSSPLGKKSIPQRRTEPVLSQYMPAPASTLTAAPAPTSLSVYAPAPATFFPAKLQHRLLHLPDIHWDPAVNPKLNASDPSSFFHPREYMRSGRALVSGDRFYFANGQPISDDAPAPTQQVSFTPRHSIDNRTPAAHIEEAHIAQIVDARKSGLETDEEDPFFQVFATEENRQRFMLLKVPPTCTLDFLSCYPFRCRCRPASRLLYQHTAALATVAPFPAAFAITSVSVPPVPAVPSVFVPPAPSASVPAPPPPAVFLAATSAASTDAAPFRRSFRLHCHPFRSRIRLYVSAAEHRRFVSELQTLPMLIEDKLAQTTPSHILAASPAIRKDLVWKLQIRRVEPAAQRKQDSEMSSRSPPIVLSHSIPSLSTSKSEL